MQINLINFREEGGIISYFFFCFLLCIKKLYVVTVERIVVGYIRMHARFMQRNKKTE